MSISMSYKEEMSNVQEYYFDKNHNVVDSKEEAYIIERFVFDDNGEYSKEVIIQADNY